MENIGASTEHYISPFSTTEINQIATNAVQIMSFTLPFLKSYTERKIYLE